MTQEEIEEAIVQIKRQLVLLDGRVSGVDQRVTNVVNNIDGAIAKLYEELEKLKPKEGG